LLDRPVDGVGHVVAERRRRRLIILGVFAHAGAEDLGAGSDAPEVCAFFVEPGDDPCDGGPVAEAVLGGGNAVQRVADSDHLALQRWVGRVDAGVENGDLDALAGQTLGERVKIQELEVPGSGGYLTAWLWLALARGVCGCRGESDQAGDAQHREGDKSGDRGAHLASGIWR
jgi:hypothetical protein